jgi:hypothetical protein
MWFVGNAAAAGQRIERSPWLLHLVWQLLQGDPAPKPLLARDPFPDDPPRWIRADIWRYEFSPSFADRWWRRSRVGVFLSPVSVDDPALRQYAAALGW